jgi:hypothetical protein
MAEIDVRKILLITRILGGEWERLWSDRPQADALPELPCRYAHIDATATTYHDVEKIDGDAFVKALKLADVTVVNGMSFGHEPRHYPLTKKAHDVLCKLPWEEIAAHAMILVHAGNVNIREATFREEYPELEALIRVAGNYNLNLGGAIFEPAIKGFADLLRRRGEAEFAARYPSALESLKVRVSEKTPAPPVRGGRGAGAPAARQPEVRRERDEALSGPRSAGAGKPRIPDDEGLPPFYGRLMEPVANISDLVHRVFPLFGPISIDLEGWKEAGFDPAYRAEIAKAYSRWPKFDRLEAVRSLFYQGNGSLAKIVRLRQASGGADPELGAVWRELSTRLVPEKAGEPAEIVGLMRRLARGDFEAGDVEVFAKWYGGFHAALDRLRAAAEATPARSIAQQTA